MFQIISIWIYNILTIWNDEKRLCKIENNIRESSNKFYKESNDYYLNIF